ncbi:hypothetical protein ACJX0J_010660, partial [Zea mays]
SNEGNVCLSSLYNYGLPNKNSTVIKNVYIAILYHKNCTNVSDTFERRMKIILNIFYQICVDDLKTSLKKNKWYHVTYPQYNATIEVGAMLMYLIRDGEAPTVNFLGTSESDARG